MSTTERFTVSGSQLLERVRQLVYEGNIRRVRVLHGERAILDLPLTIGAPAAAVLIVVTPLLAALSIITALLTECTIEVEKTE